MTLGTHDVTASGTPLQDMSGTIFGLGLLSGFGIGRYDGDATCSDLIVLFRDHGFLGVRLGSD